MATQNKNANSSGNRKNTGNSGNRRNTGSRGSSGRGGGKKMGGGSDKLLNLFLALLLVTIVVLAIVYFRKSAKEKEGEPTPAPTQTVQPGGVTVPPKDLTGEPEDMSPAPTQGVPEPSPTPASEPTQAPEHPTGEPEAPTPTPESPADETPSPTPQVTVPAAGGIGTAEADEILGDVFWEEGYRFTLSDSGFSADGKTYYRYDVFYNGKAQKYDMLVGKEDGGLYYYEDGARREFDGLPVHTEQVEDGEIQNGMTADMAAELLGQFPYTSLGLPAALDECSLVLDNWKTVVQGEECFCLNVFYNGTLAGNLYFTEDAGCVYYLDEFGEFVRVR